MHDELDSRTAGRIVLIGGLLLFLVVGLVWAFNPSDRGGITFSTDAAGLTEGGEDPASTATTAPTVGEPGAVDPAPTPQVTPTPTPEPTETEPSAEELIAAAPDPAETTVQVLDAGGGSAATEDAAATLRAMGYQVVNVTSARAALDVSTIWFNEGTEDAASALRARDERIVDLQPNQALSTGVDLHLLVGSNWSGR